MISIINPLNTILCSASDISGEREKFGSKDKADFMLKQSDGITVSPFCRNKQGE